MKKLALYLAILAALVVSAFGAQILWGDGPVQAADGDSIVWGG